MSENTGKAERGPATREDPEKARAFVAVRHGERGWVVDIPCGRSTLLGPTSASLVILDPPPEHESSIEWDGERLILHQSPEIFVGGKRMEGDVDLKPGDELALGLAHLVVGITSPGTPSARRALTHQEFRERIAEELARARRGDRSTALVMVQARSGEGGALLAAALEQFRAGDVVATYAHDEIEILLPDTTSERAKAVVSRVLSNGGFDGAFVTVRAAPEDADHPERLMRAVRNALQVCREAHGNRQVSKLGSDEPMLVDVASRHAAAELERRVDARTRRPILLVGEASAGKVAFARRAHRRAGDGAFAVLVCTRDGSAEALESCIREARGGTLVLDEVSELSAPAQERLASKMRSLAQATRIIATTQRILRAHSERGAFHRDLAKWFEQDEAIVIPPLRQRPDDIVPLATQFAEEAGAVSPVRYSAGALVRLRSHPWPGNVLELRNAVERAVRLAVGGEILAEHLPSEQLTQIATDGRLREHVDSLERDTIVKALAESNHNQTHAAKRLGLSRRALIYKMEKYGLKSPPGMNRRS
jgi:transcriptional regulator with AAA-type ATPase domain